MNTFKLTHGKKLKQNKICRPNLCNNRETEKYFYKYLSMFAFRKLSNNHNGNERDM